MTETLAVASFRRVTPAIVASARLAMANDVPDTSKAEAAIILKKAAPVLGIDGTAYHVMDILLGLSRADDWHGDGRPIVAISNAKLAEYTMRSERTVIRCLRQLVEAGIAAYRDSPTGRRYVYRDKNGTIESGFGIDFTPARVRLAELKAAVERYQERLRVEAAARRDVVRLSRAIKDLSEAFPDRAAQWMGDLDHAAGGASDEVSRAEQVKAVYASVAAEAELMPVHSEESCEGDIDVTSYTNTTRETSLKRKQRPRSNERESLIENDGYAVEKALEKKPRGSGGAKQAANPPADRKAAATIQSEVLGSVSIGLLALACREAQAFTGVKFETWAGVAQAGETLRRMIGLSDAGWQDGRARVGLHAASAIVATVLEKSLRDPDQINKPGGYFRAMVDRAAEGRLHLEKSLFGLADGAVNGAGGGR